MSDTKERLKLQLKGATDAMKWALTSEAAPRINAMLDLARSEPGIPLRANNLDKYPWLFNCINGTLDLHTGKLREHCRNDLLTKLCPVVFDPNALCPTFERTVNVIFKKDEKLIQFVKRSLGCCLSGDVSEQILPIWYGHGANGKTTLANAIMDTLGGDYAMKASADLLMQSRSDRHPTEQAQLFGMRLVVASESNQGRRLNEALVKDLTGGEKIRARRMKEDFWQFEPTHKVILLTNYKPKIRGTDKGMWRRIRLVPFEVEFWNPNDPATQKGDPELRQDPQLPDKLRAETPGILAWLVRGCLDWLKDGLTLPDKVRNATSTYRKAEDSLQQFLEERCVIGPEYRCKRSAIYDAYEKWCKSMGEEALTGTPFGEALTDRKFERFTNNGVWYRGVALRPEDASTEPTEPTEPFPG